MIRFIGNKILISTFFRNKLFTGSNLNRSFCLGQEQIVDVRGQIINYVKVGTGDKIVLCFPGTLGTIWTDFRPQVEGLDRQKLTVIAWDPPGYGGSRPPNRTFDTNFYEDDAETAYDFMMRLGIRKFSLLGWSDGGISSLILAGKHPESVDKLIVWGAGSYILPQEMKHYDSMGDISKWPENERAPLVAVYTEKHLQTLWTEWCNACKNISIEGGDICKYCLRYINCPTLILHGDKDTMRAAEHPCYLHSHIKNAKLYRFPYGNHDIHIKYAEEFNRIVTNFLFNKYCSVNYYY